MAQLVESLIPSFPLHMYRKTIILLAYAQFWTPCDRVWEIDTYLIAPGSQVEAQNTCRIYQNSLHYDYPQAQLEAWLKLGC